MRGEYPSLSVTCRLTLGSPPHTRGVSFLLSTSSRPLRITPACAENTFKDFKNVIGARDHPRLRGEYNRFLFHFLPLSGITPACAGNTLFFLLPLLHSRDHPRLRGEYQSIYFPTQLLMGSPPLARGILSRCAGATPDHGITPACAGNTCYTCFSFPGSWDHPRLRGEYISSGVETDYGTGSPPLARGIQIQLLPNYFHQGITPACAGNTWMH